MNVIFEKLQSFMTPVKTNFLWMMLANGIYALCQWGMLVILAKLGSPAIVGQFALALAIISPVIMITNMQLRGVQATDAKKEYFLSDYIAVRVLSTIAALFLIVSILYFGHFSSAVFLATVMLALAKVVESISDVFYGFFQQHEKMGFMARSMIFKGIFSVAVLGFVFYFSSSLFWALTGLLGTWLLVLIFYDWQKGRSLRIAVEENSRGLIALTIASFRERRGILVRIMVLAFPLGVVMGILSLNANVPRYAIEKYLGTRNLGIFAALAYAVVAVGMFIQALGQAVSPRLARYFEDRDTLAFKSILKKMIWINLGIGLFGILMILVAGEPILSFIYTEEYATHTKLFMILMIYSTLSGIGSVFGYGMTAARKFACQVPLYLTVLGVTLVASFVLIPCFQLYGAALALIVSSCVEILAGAFIVKWAMRIR